MARRGGHVHGRESKLSHAVGGEGAVLRAPGPVTLPGCRPVYTTIPAATRWGSRRRGDAPRLPHPAARRRSSRRTPSTCRWWCCGRDVRRASAARSARRSRAVNRRTIDPPSSAVTTLPMSSGASLASDESGTSMPWTVDRGSPSRPPGRACRTSSTSRSWCRTSA